MDEREVTQWTLRVELVTPDADAMKALTGFLEVMTSTTGITAGTTSLTADFATEAEARAAMDGVRSERPDARCDVEPKS